MWSDLFADTEARASYERLIRQGLDQRMAFMIAATDRDYRLRVKTGCTQLEAYARTLKELARLNALLEGYGPNIIQERAEAVYEKTLREGLDDPTHPHAERLFPQPPPRGSSK